MHLKNCVLVVVDVQNGFVHPQSAHAVPVVLDLVQRWEAAGGDMVFTRFINQPDSLFVRLFDWPQLMTSPQIDLIDDLVEPAARSRGIIDKPAYTPFTEAGVDLFTKGGWTDMFVCGLTTESCVLATALDAFQHGIVPWVVTDATATHAGPAAFESGLLVTRRFVGPRQLVQMTDLTIGADGIVVAERDIKIVHNIT
ncbi:isochorismatase family cysteine hydrolase [Catellatospora sp. NPDC049133]|uniref:isochorismatase family cysteine hydrolase n=1 Tax=Catellatospora sp. NPDC049133 TaxID=3155499 RepID=UPI0034063A15